MIRFVLVAFVIGTAVPAVAQTIQDVAKLMDNMLAIQGIGEIVHAQEQCGFMVDNEALNRYLDKRGFLTPDAMAKINMEIELAGIGDEELTSTECSMRKATAAEIGVLAN